MTKIEARFDGGMFRITASLPMGQLPDEWEQLLRAVVGEELEVVIEGSERGVVNASARSNRSVSHTIDGFPREDAGDQEEEP